jgi:hypothetical protein
MIDIDLKRQFSGLNKPSARVPAIVKVPRLRFLMLDGAGDIGDSAFQEASKALFGLAFPVKFAAKKRLALRYPVMPLEGLFWDREGRDLTPELRATAAWRLMTLLPDEISSEFVDEVRAKVVAKKNLARLSDIRVETFSEGISVQMMHLGPYAGETDTIKALFTHAAEKGLDVTGRHHEIFLSKPERSDQSKLKTVVRYGVTRQK